MINIEFFSFKSFDKLIPNAMILLFGICSLFIPYSLQIFVPNLMLCVLYFWGVYAPEKVYPVIILMVGLVQDTHLGLPLGIFSFGNLVFFVIALSYHHYLSKKPFFLSWLIFSFIIICTNFLKLGVNTFALAGPFEVNTFFYEAVITILSYPAIASLCFNFHQKFRKTNV